LTLHTASKLKRFPDVKIKNLRCYGLHLLLKIVGITFQGAGNTMSKSCAQSNYFKMMIIAI